MAGPPEPPCPPPTPAEWRAAMGYFPTGVTIVTTWRDGMPVGSTVNAFTSVSLNPPMLLVCLDVANPITDPLRACGVFGVNILGDRGAGLAMDFATMAETERFERHGHRCLPDGAPWLEAAPVFIECVVEQMVLAGDHYVVIGRALRTEHEPDVRPLVYQRGGFLKLPEAD
jgi:3-hydroxy-9,10-secoandrosta-1,3,5(10)-triene-9,17-dione monooxygenase reductase component